jgi:hypothetical protein
MALFGTNTKTSSASSSGLSQSGAVKFRPKNRIYADDKPLVDLTNPLEILTFGGLVFLGWYAWGRIK